MSRCNESAIMERRLAAVLRASRLTCAMGRVQAIHGMVLEASGLQVRLGDLVDIQATPGRPSISAEVVALRHNRAVLMPHGELGGLSLASTVVARHQVFKVPVGEGLLGRVVDACGAPLDGLPQAAGLVFRPILAAPINPMQRLPIEQVLVTGVRAVDVFVPLGRGQRIGIFAGSGVGKTTLLAMLTQHTEADVIIIALIGERGREVGDFVRACLGETGLRRAVVIAASADQPAILRRQAAYTATTMAEWFRDQGRHVLLIMDSITRFALAQREIGLASGEAMGSRGYPPSVFALLPALLERAGAVQGQGSITAVYTVLVEGDDMNEPIADHMRAILDGHLVLDRQAAARGYYPAIDVMHSISRLADVLRSSEQQQISDRIRQGLALYHNSEDLIRLGAYVAGTHHALDQLIEIKPALDAFLCQRPTEKSEIAETWQRLQMLAERLSGGDDHAY